MVRSKKFKSPGELVFDVVNVLLLTIFAIVCLYPVVYVFSCSISRGSLVDAGSVILFPKDVNLESYKQVLQAKQFWISYANTLYYTIFGSLYSMFISTPAAYALSKRNFGARKYINMLVAFTMWFTPGFIPLYLNYKSLGAINSRWMIVVSFGVVAFNIILLRNYFEAVPGEIEESAKIDGANEWHIFWNICLPQCRSALYSIAILVFIDNWNMVEQPLILLNDVEKQPLSMFLSSINAGEIGIAFAAAVVYMIPGLLLFLHGEAYLVEGIAYSGSVKG